MAVAYRSQSTTTYASRSNTSVSVPSGTANDDILIAHIFVGAGSSAPTVTQPAGFTQIGTTISMTDGGSFNGKVSVYWKRASGESGSYVFSHSTASSQLRVAAYSGCKTSGSPINASSQNNGTGTTLTATGITTTVADVLGVWLSNDWQGNGTLSPPGGSPTFTERFDSLIYAADATFTSAGATGNKTQTSSGNGSENWAAFLIGLEPASGPVNKTLDANAGSYAVGGTAANLKRNRRTAADSGSYAVTGTNATLRRGFKIAANSETYAVTGTNASFTRTWRVISNTGSYSVTGTAANLEVHRRLAADSGTYSISGTNAALKVGKALVAQTGTYAIAGTDATVRLVRKLAAASGSYSITGSDATLTKTSDKVVILEPGAYAISGTNATLSKTQAIVAETGGYTISGQGASLLHGRALKADGASYTITGQTATFARSYNLMPVSGEYTINGTPAQLYKGDQPAGGTGRGSLWSMWLKLGQGKGE